MARSSKVWQMIVGSPSGIWEGLELFETSTTASGIQTEIQNLSTINNRLKSVDLELIAN